MCENKNPLEIKKIVERISGNESIAYQIALFEILAESCEIEIPKSLKQKYATLLEIERIIHHITDIGFIPNDAGFGAALAYASKLTEETRRILAKLTGHRFGFGAIKENIEIDYKELIEFVDYLEQEIIYFRDWIFDIPSVWDRLDTTGILTIDKAVKYSVVGVGARACGLEIDRRNNEWYKNFGFVLQTEESSDVAARFKLRIKEILNSIEIIKNLKTFENKTIKFSKFKDGEYTSFVESSIGELFMFIKIKNGLVDRFYVRDASHINWQAFHTTIYKDIIADFPLINKSFDLSYAGNDL
jgi:Ni,Fe-hydrogenase III large subunit